MPFQELPEGQIHSTFSNIQTPQMTKEDVEKAIELIKDTTKNREDLHNSVITLMATLAEKIGYILVKSEYGDLYAILKKPPTLKGEIMR